MTPEGVGDVIKNLSEYILRYAITLAAVSALSMALLEAVKALGSVRDRFHKRRVRNWIERVTVPGEVLISGAPIPPDDRVFHEHVYGELVWLTTAEQVDATAITGSIEWKPWHISPSNALFALDAEKMMGQIQDAADAALNDPGRCLNLYLFLTDGAHPEDITNWYTWAGQPPVSTAADPTLAKRQADTYTRLRQFIRRRLDAFQLTTGYQWQTVNQIASVVLGALLLGGSLLYLDRTVGWLLVPLSLAGGFLAPVAKDLVLALKRVRSG